MTDKLTDLQIRILRALGEHKQKRIAKGFSMDAFYKNLPVEVKKSRFQASKSSKIPEITPGFFP